MEAVKPVQDPFAQVLALAPDCDATQLRLSAAEGYLLSRIDGVTPWRLLREIAGLPAAEVDACLGRWIEEGLLTVVGPAAGRAPARPAGASGDAGSAAPESPGARAEQAPARPSAAIDERALDESLELGLPLQRRILEFEASLDRPYHELLGVERGVDAKVVKRAYFKLSKEFHPDRYFRREIGHYGARLERIFKKILEAHEMLTDPELCGIENQPAAAPAPPSPQTAPVDAASAAPSAAESRPAPRRLTKLERLRQRMPFKIDHAAIEARRAKALEIFRAAETSQRAGRLQEAEANIRIAISFDPGRAEFKEALGALRLQAAGARAAKLLASPNERMSDGELRELLTLLEDVLLYRPHDPELNERAARVCLKLGKLAPAQEYAETCVGHSPEVPAYHTLLGRIHREQGDLDAALHEFETALKHDANDRDAQRALASVRIGHRDAVRGGMG